MVTDNIEGRKMENIKSWDAYTFEQLVGGGNKVFEIPLFQRNYSWDKESCKQFFDDIFTAYKNKEAYYIGNFMFYTSSDTTPKFAKYILIDGQQRITSLLLLLCAMRDTFNSLTTIDVDFINNNDNKEKYKYKLKQNYNDYDDFKNILDGKKVTNKKSSINDAYEVFVGLLQSYCLSGSDALQLYQTIKNLESVGIELRNDNIEKVQGIFEKINSTGVALSAADLIRNYLLFSPSIDLQSKLHRYWKIIEEMIGEGNVSSFAKSYLIRFLHKDIKNADVYKEFKKTQSGKDHEDVLKDLVKYAVYYSLIEGQKFYKVNDDCCLQEISYVELTPSQMKLRVTFALLNAIGSDDLDPLFMQLCERLYDSDLDKLNDICELILEFLIRFRIVSPTTGSGALYSKISKIIEAIDEGVIRVSKNDIYKMLSDNKNSEASRYPGDAEFKNALLSSVQINRARVLLFQLSRRKKIELGEDAFNKNSTTVEHLMPQTIDAQDKDGKWWIRNLGGRNEWEKVHEEYLNCIGNLALVSKSLNSTMSNSQWGEKRSYLMERAMDKETQKVANCVNWTKKEIKKRNRRLTKEIINTITGPKNENSTGNKWLV